MATPELASSGTLKVPFLRRHVRRQGKHPKLLPACPGFGSGPRGRSNSSGAMGKRLDLPPFTSPGAVQLIFTVSNIDQLATWLTEGGLEVAAASAGGKPLSVTDGSGSSRTILFQDFNGFFVKLVQPAMLLPRVRRDRIELPPAASSTALEHRRDRRGMRKKRRASIAMCSGWMSEGTRLIFGGRKTVGRIRSRGRGVPRGFDGVSREDSATPLFEFKGVARKPLHPLPPGIRIPRSSGLAVTHDNMDGVIARVKAAGESDRR